MRFYLNLNYESPKRFLFRDNVFPENRQDLLQLGILNLDLDTKNGSALRADKTPRIVVPRITKQAFIL